MNPVDLVNHRLRYPDIDYEFRPSFADKVWTANQKADWDPWIERIRKCRNSIHAFRKVNMGDFVEWRQQLRMHLMFVRALNAQLPYPT